MDLNPVWYFTERYLRWNFNSTEKYLEMPPKSRIKKREISYCDFRHRRGGAPDGFSAFSEVWRRLLECPCKALLKGLPSKIWSSCCLPPPPFCNGLERTTMVKFFATRRLSKFNEAFPRGEEWRLEYHIRSKNPSIIESCEHFDGMPPIYLQLHGKVSWRTRRCF